MSDPQPETVAVMNWIRYFCYHYGMFWFHYYFLVDIPSFYQQIFTAVIWSQTIHMMPVATDRCPATIKVSFDKKIPVKDLYF